VSAAWGAVAVGVVLLAGALLRFMARKAPPPRRASPALKDAVKLADLCREARAFSSRKAWSLLDVQLVRIEEAVLGLLEKMETELHHGDTEARRPR